MIMMMTFLLVANPRHDASDLQDALNAILSDDETTLPTKVNTCCLLLRGFDIY